MGLLTDMFRAKMAQEKDPRMSLEKEFDVAYPTGFLVFDFANGATVNVVPHDGRPSYSYPSIGIPDGTMVTCFGRSGCGKTTFILQASGNMIAPYKDSTVFHDDLEGGISDLRKRRLLKFRTEEEFKSRYICRNSGITSENLFERICAIHDMKLENAKAFEYDTGLEDIDGRPIRKLQPTVYILDSLMLLMPDKYVAEDGDDANKLASQMAAPAIARLNTQLIRRIIPKLKTANIIFFLVNHILPDPSLLPKKAQNAWLKVGERLPGGETAVFLANNILRFDDGGTKLQKGKDFDIDGIIVNLQLCKTRTNKPGTIVPMVLNYNEGFDPELSMFVLLNNTGRIVAGAYSYIKGYPEMKFQKRSLKEKLTTDAEFREVFINEVYAALESLLGAGNDVDVEEVEAPNITSAMIDRIRNSRITAA